MHRINAWRFWYHNSGRGAARQRQKHLYALRVVAIARTGSILNRHWVFLSDLRLHNELHLAIDWTITEAQFSATTVVCFLHTNAIFYAFARFQAAIFATFVVIISFYCCAQKKNIDGWDEWIWLDDRQQCAAHCMVLVWTTCPVRVHVSSAYIHGKYVQFAS